jgi:uncharacterized membrane protein YfcA
MTAALALVHEIGAGYLLLALGIVALGAMTQFAIGMGLNLFSVGALALIHPALSPGPVLVLSFILSVMASIALRRDIEGGLLALSALGLAIGSVIAVVILLQLGAQGLPRAIGALIILGVVLAVAGAHCAVTPRNVLLATTAAGIVGAIAGTHGAPVALLYQREDPKRVRAALLPLFAIANPLALAALAYAGLFGVREIIASLLLIPGLLIGYVASPLVVRFLSPRAARAGLLAISAASGVLLLIKG